MDHIKVALEKAQASQKTHQNHEIMNVMGAPDAPGVTSANTYVTFASPSQVQLNEKHLEKSRVVAHNMVDPSHMAFNMLRTKVYSTLCNNGWKSIAISSPGPGCGKTMVSINLALSLARQANCKTVLVDLDLRRPAVAKTLGLPVENSILEYLTGATNIEECFVKVGENLILALNDQPVRNSSEVMLHQRCRKISHKIMEILAPDVILFDLPPMLSSDDTMGFLPSVDASMLIIAEGTSTYKEVDECDLRLTAANNFLGHVLNKSTDPTEAAYQYYGI